MLFTMSLTAMGQTNTIMKSPLQEGKFSIIREWKNGWSVLFAREISGNSYFALWRSGYNTARTASIPSNTLITDFRVHNDSVFYIGTYTDAGGTHYGFAGFFDIPQMFYGGDAIYYDVISTMTYPEYVQTTIPRRMDLYEKSGITHIVFVGECELHPTPGAYHRSTVYDIYYSGSNWVCNFYFNKDGNEYYTDIVASNSYVVAVARDTNYTKCYVDVYYPSGAISYTPLIPNYTLVLTDEPPVSDICLEALSSDVFAMAYQYKNTVLAGSTIKTFQVDNIIPTISILDSYTTPHGLGSLFNNGWEARQLRFDSFSNTLLFLQKTSYTSVPTSESILCQYDMATLGSGIELFSFNTGYDWFRIDILQTINYQKIGEDISGILSIEKQSSATSTGCLTIETLNYSPSITSVTLENKYGRELYANNNISGVVYPTIGVIPMELICEY